MARQRVSGLCQGMDIESAQAAELMVSELVTSAFQHRPQRVTLTATRVPQSLHVDVCEETREPPVAAADPRSTPQRPGLMIVERLAEEWGTKSSAHGTARTVWFTLDAPQAVQP